MQDKDAGRGHADPEIPPNRAGTANRPIDAVTRAMHSGAGSQGTSRTMQHHDPTKERHGAGARPLVRGPFGFAVIS